MTGPRPASSPASPAVAAYNAAADSYDAPANTFWERFGRRTIERLRLPVGASVLDVCCGSGASAIPAAETVGPQGIVLGVDLAENLLALARAKARARRLANVEFRAGDLLDLDVPTSDFDAVVCVFGIFFVQDMTAAVRALWRLVRPGGRLAVTTWGPRFLEPGRPRSGTPSATSGLTSTRASIRGIGSPIRRRSRPCSARAAPITWRRWPRPARIRSPPPRTWWSAVLGTGYRGTLEQLDPNARERVRAANGDFIRRSGIRAVEANVVYATATKAPGTARGKEST